MSQDVDLTDPEAVAKAMADAIDSALAADLRRGIVRLSSPATYPGSTDATRFYGTIDTGRRVRL